MIFMGDIYSMGYYREEKGIVTGFIARKRP